ncbi:hypothetical protein GUITHDRAFT_107339 [Guillardia theta CCMP2712]|uniref:Uncharacterized protein n=1 Tax=Guillardia theta (strain CCMP2712) TaxID=905079 RepID=L1JES1_GUITC|nr:hypothetical protein GUITHDRAFT_107339 [Guillardia theta CCMP2712]EKX46991.1 hypothetical protein GUITHDRAFT_107339 [Guillardia theta CCMP2712]|mmetsp:Transcript_22251/g.73226  ORF Transcript_22251/g.73226 Transcript_22251/m.73226 type:complete len:906 (-) Transcript_22251:1003-3720(-)|eukprot:XP_005833971.1 hypothetical protein GUITHDRAFT_107339 [Guillardia theta CCMP2712]
MHSDDEEEDEEMQSEEDEDEEMEEGEEMEVAEESESLRAELQLNPRVETLLKQALMLQLSGKLQQAVHAYLMSFKVQPSIAEHFVDEFLKALASHSSELMDQGDIETAISMHRLACSVFPRNLHLLTELGRLSFLSGKEVVAADCWRRVLSMDDDYIVAQESLDLLNGRAINRWHYRMINDPVRNQCYADAIARAVARSGDQPKVLDIGCGTGLLAMYAAQARPGVTVWGCELSEPIADLAGRVLEANGLRERVRVLACHSDDIVIDDGREGEHLTCSIPSKVDVVVTETADCGLLGEGMLPSLSSAQSRLLAHRGQMIPSRADVYCMLVCSPILRSQGRMNAEAHCGLKMCSDNVFIPQDPYLCEYLTESGHSPLCDPFLALTVPFDMSLGGMASTRQHRVRVTQGGRVDALVMWYHLWLDSEGGFSTSPSWSSLPQGMHLTTCWEQAVFIPDNNFQVEGGDEVDVLVSCSAKNLHWRLRKSDMTSWVGTAGEDEDGNQVIKVGERVISVLNDKHKNEAYEEALKRAMRSLRMACPGTPLHVLDLSHGWSLCGLLAARCGADKVLIMDPPDETQALMEIINDNHFDKIVEIFDPLVEDFLSIGIRRTFSRRSSGHSLHEKLVRLAMNKASPFREDPQQAQPPPSTKKSSKSSFMWSAAKGKKSTKDPKTREKESEASPSTDEKNKLKGPQKSFHIIVLELIDPGGMLTQGILEDVRLAKEWFLTQDKGLIFPSSFCLRFVCLQSDQMVQDNRVNKAAQHGPDVSLLDTFSVRTLMSVDLRCLRCQQITGESKLLNVDLASLQHQQTDEVVVEAMTDGRIDGIVFWFELRMGDVTLETYDRSRPMSSPAGHLQQAPVFDSDAHPPHWRQAAWIFKEGVQVQNRERLKVQASLQGSYLSFKITRQT